MAWLLRAVEGKVIWIRRAKSPQFRDSNENSFVLDPTENIGKLKKNIWKCILRAPFFWEEIKIVLVLFLPGKQEAKKSLKQIWQGWFILREPKTKNRREIWVVGTHGLIYGIVTLTESLLKSRRETRGLHLKRYRVAHEETGSIKNSFFLPFFTRDNIFKAWCQTVCHFFCIQSWCLLRPKIARPKGRQCCGLPKNILGIF